MKLERIIRRRTESVVADAAADEQLALASCLFAKVVMVHVLF